MPMLRRAIAVQSILAAVVLAMGAYLAYAHLVVSIDAGQPHTTVAENTIYPAEDSALDEAVVVVPESVLAPILVYHNIRPRHEAPANVDEAYDVTPEEFDAHLGYLREQGYTALTHREFTEALDGQRLLPEKPVLIDIDDGRATQMRYAAPILERHGFVATFFVFTNAIGRDGYLTWDDLTRLRDAGHEIASHTVFHPYLTRIAPDEVVRELANSKRVLDERLEQDTVSLAYPFGLSNATVRDVAQETGYTSARGLRHTALHGNVDRYDRGAYIVTGPLGQFLGIMATER